MKEFTINHSALSSAFQHVKENHGCAGVDGVTIERFEISSLLDGLGFDPYLGYFHNVNYGRASLAADLIEEFRAPIADRFTLNLINNRIVGKEDFYTNPKGA